MEHRALSHLAALMRRYPQLPDYVDTFLADKGVGLPDWPPWCFIPKAAWYAIVVATDGDPYSASVKRAEDIAILGALAPWRYTQGIYRIDTTLVDALVDTPLDNILPADVFLRLPQWSVYIELPRGRLQWMGAPLHGYWASLEWHAGREQGRRELHLLLDMDDSLALTVLFLGPWTVAESLRRVVAEAQRNADDLGIDMTLSPGLPAALAENITPLLSLLLYLCADQPEVDDEREPGHSPYNPQPKRVKRGWRLFPPPRPTVWRVGDAIGAQLRQAVQNAHAEREEGEQRTVRTHIRRGHWHGYWTGPRDPERADARGFIYHWLPPMVIGA